VGVSQVEAALEKLGVAHRRQGNRAWAERCPLPTHGSHNTSHDYQNWFIRVERGEFHGTYTCFSCKGRGNLVGLVMLLKGVEYRDAKEWLATIEEQETEAPFLRVRSVAPKMPGAIALPDGLVKSGAPLAEWNSVAREYVESRGITDAQVAAWRIGYAMMGRLEGRIFLPIYDQHGRLANYAARSFVGHEKRYLAAGTWERPDKSALFGEHLWKKERRVVLLFEGALNGLALDRAGEGAYDLAGMSGLDEGGGGQVEVRTLMKLASFPLVVAATDPDGPGDRVAAAIARALRNRADVARLELPGVDAADLWQEDPGELRRRLAVAASGVR